MKAALLIVDMQKGLLRESTRASMTSALEYINETSRLFRKNGQPVVVVQDMEVGNGPGSDEFGLIDGVETAGTDITVYKSYCNAFWQTDLDDKLKKLDAGFVVVSGYHAQHCVLFTFNGARELGYKVSLLQHGISGDNAGGVDSAQLLRPVVSLEALEYFLERG